MHPGGSDGAFDLWKAQGWVRSDKSHKRRASDHLETPPRYLPRQFAIDPPSYDDCDAAPLITTTHPTPSHDQLVLPTASRQVFLPLTHEPLNRPPQECKDHVKPSATTFLSAPTAVFVASTVLPAPSASPASVDVSVAAETIPLPTAAHFTAVTVPVSSHTAQVLPFPIDASPAALPVDLDSSTGPHAELVLDGPDQFRPRNWSTSSHLGTGPVRTGSSQLRTGRTGELVELVTSMGVTDGRKDVTFLVFSLHIFSVRRYVLKGPSEAGYNISLETIFDTLSVSSIARADSRPR